MDYAGFPSRRVLPNDRLFTVASQESPWVCGYREALSEREIPVRNYTVLLLHQLDEAFALTEAA
jgi:hypothetical protein